MTPRILRIAAVVGIVGASSFFAGTAAHATNTVTFECSTPADGEPGLTPPPSPPADNGIPPANNRTPPPNCTPDSGEVVWGTRPVQFTVKSGSGQHIRSVALYILADEPKIPHANSGDPVLYEEFADGAKAPRTKTYRFTWDSVELNRYNGRYKLYVASSTWNPNFPSGYVSEQSPPVQRPNILVDNEPRPLKPVSMVATTSTSVSVRWDKATEPDVLSYTLYRAVTSGSAKRPSYADLKPIVTTQTTSYRDDDVKPAAYWYSVKVTRRSIVTPETGISSAFSPLSSAATVEPTPPPPPPGASGGPSAAAKAASLRRFVPLTTLTAPQTSNRSTSVPDAPYSAFLPYDKPDAGNTGAIGGAASEEAGSDPRGFVLPVAVGAFLVSSAMALGRMPF